MSKQDSRRIVMAANWKMYKNEEEAAGFMSQFKSHVADPDVEIVICPPALLIPTVVREAAGTSINVGIQNIHWEMEGAYTGENSPAAAADVGCAYCICGHSERRHYFEESHEMITRKAQAALSCGLYPIVCIGETKEQRENMETMEVLESQLQASLAGIEGTSDILIAYEPIWAIGTGIACGAAEAEEAIAHIRSVLRALWGKVADEISILYGGSVKPNNVAELMACPNIDGALVGGASLKADSFAAIVNYNK